MSNKEERGESEEERGESEEEREREKRKEKRAEREREKSEAESENLYEPLITLFCPFRYTLHKKGCHDWQPFLWAQRGMIPEGHDPTTFGL